MVTLFQQPAQNSVVPASREEALFLHVLQAREHGIFSNGGVLAYSSSEQPTEVAAVLRPVDELNIVNVAHIPVLCLHSGQGC